MRNRETHFEPMGFNRLTTHPMQLVGKDVNSSQFKSQIWILIALISASLLAAGCQEASTAVAKKKTSSLKPVFFDGTEVDGADSETAPKQTATGQDISFLHPGIYGCFSLNMSSITSNADLTEIPWDDLEIELKKMFGESNGAIANVKRVWLLLDSQAVESMGSNGIVLIVDTNEPVDEKGLELFADYIASNTEELEEDEKAAASQLKARKLSPTRFAVGDENQLQLVSGSANEMSTVASKIAQLKLDDDVAGALVFDPIRSTIQSAIDMAGNFSAEAKKFSTLPDDLESIDVNVSLTADQFVSAVVNMNNEDMVEKIADMASKSMEGNGGGGMPLAGMLGGAGGMGGFGMGGGSPKTMFEDSSADIMAEVGKDIQDRELFKVDSTDRTISFSLQRPEKLKELISSLVTGAQQGLEVASRTQKLETIAKALEKYEEEYGCLPPSGPITPKQAEEKKIPAQLNWRVGILPSMGRNELYERFDFDKPWDSDENLKVAEEMPEEFATTTEDSNKTNWMIPAGNGTVYSADSPDATPKLSEIKDRTIWTAIVMESSPESASVWTAPEIMKIKNDFQMEQFGRNGENGLFHINANFDVRIAIKEADIVEAILTSAGEERLARNRFIPTPKPFGQ